MKFIHCADLHLDSKIDIKDSIKSSQRRSEVLSTFERLCNYASENDIVAVIIAGDLFDANKVTKKSFERVIGAISQANNVDFLYLSGNHDQDAKIDFSLFPENFKTFNQHFTSFRYGEVVIGGIAVQNGLSSTDYEQIMFNKQDFNILVLHGQIANYKGKTKTDVISMPRLVDKNIDYLALGHYHSFSYGEIDNRGKYAYSGCLEGRGFDETGDKGFVLIDCDNKQNPFEFVKFNKRDVYEFEFDVTAFDSWAYARNELFQTINKKFSSESMIKVEIVGERQTDFYIDEKEIEKTLNDHFFYAKIEDKTVLKISQNDLLNDKSFKGEFIRLVWESQLSEQEKKAVITCGLNALNGEDLL